MENMIANNLNGEKYCTSSDKSFRNFIFFLQFKNNEVDSINSSIDFICCVWNTMAASETSSEHGDVVYHTHAIKGVSRKTIFVC